MELGTLVEYETGPGSSGIGFVSAYEEQTEIVTVVDEDDGSTWRGPLDKTSVVED